ncbi:hypothetical protein ZEAMMB73_Zm00001d023610 [Zea mays]|uniref:Uncharacterized protein n=1 Tax=Zea mays TaxID=4577 RepID=A0A1D6IUE7_MAIZE|nr:hypothetical protein ZEAMMB73_Zm00001d023610 [Zea mays]
MEIVEALHSHDIAPVSSLCAKYIVNLLPGSVAKVLALFLSNVVRCSGQLFMLTSCVLRMFPNLTGSSIYGCFSLQRLVEAKLQVVQLDANLLSIRRALLEQGIEAVLRYLKENLLAD